MLKKKDDFELCESCKYFHKTTKGCANPEVVCPFGDMPLCDGKCYTPITKWKVPVYWQMKAVVEVEADTLEEAIEKVRNDDGPLPSNGEYLDCTWEAGEDDVEYVRENYNNNQPDNC